MTDFAYRSAQHFLKTGPARNGQPFALAGVSGWTWTPNPCCCGPTLSPSPIPTMPEDWSDPEMWLDDLPPSFNRLVVPPLRFETHVDHDAHALKVVGLDARGSRCYIRHTHTMTEDRFDIDEFPLEVAVLRERHMAWRLASQK